MSEPKSPVWLFVIHVLTPAAQLARVVGASRCRQAVVLTSHAPYPPERDVLSRALAPVPVVFVSFAELFADDELASLDAATSRELLAHPSPWSAYADRYERLVTRKKNAAVLAHLNTQFAIDRCFCTAGPGIDTEFWRQQGAHGLGPADPLAWLKTTPPARVFQALRRRLRRPPKMGTLIEEEGRRYLFISSLRRLKLRPGTIAREVPVHTAAARADFLATTLHDHPEAVHRLGRPVRVFADAFLPSNYPRSYLDGYGNVEFVSNDPIALRWFKNCGMPAARAPGFIAQTPFPPASSRPEIRTVITLLGHGGDWSALIHRSDTDLLVMAAVDLARAVPSLQVVIRLHPTMDHPRHEGPGARDRIRTFVTGTGLPNLTVSRETLDGDLNRGDFFISEYSATLVDVWKAGHLGIAVNLTRRRSFMQDFVDLGFPEVNNVNDIERTIKDVRATPAAFTTRQNAAAERYNALVKALPG